MALFKMLWLRKLVRRNTRPIPLDTASVWKNRLSIGYAIIAWNAFGFVCWMVYNGRSDWMKYHGYKSEEDMQMSPAQQFAKQLNISNAKVMRFSGLEKTQEFTVNADGTVREEE